MLLNANGCKERKRKQKHLFGFSIWSTKKKQEVRTTTLTMEPGRLLPDLQMSVMKALIEWPGSCMTTHPYTLPDDKDTVP